MSFKTSLAPTHSMGLSGALPTQGSSPRSHQFPAHFHHPARPPRTTQDCWGLERGGLAPGPDLINHRIPQTNLWGDRGRSRQCDLYQRSITGTGFLPCACPPARDTSATYPSTWPASKPALLLASLHPEPTQAPTRKSRNGGGARHLLPLLRREMRFIQVAH